MDRATPSRPHSTRQLDDDPVILPGRSPVGKIVLALVVLAVLGGAGFFVWHGWSGSVAREKVTRAALALAKKQGGGETLRANQTAAKLATAEAELATLRALQVDVAPSRIDAPQIEGILTKLREALGDAGEAAAAHGRVTLVLPESALFEAGEAEVTEDGTAALGRLGKALAAFPATEVAVQAHTGDRRPRDKKAFPSNWELSTSRALAVVHSLEDESDLDGKRLVVAGVGQYRPRSTDRAVNPRIEIVVSPLLLPPVVSPPPGTTAAPRRAGPRRPPRPRESSSGLGAL